MAIDNLYSETSPYVHSNIYNLTDEIETYFQDFSEGNLEGLQETIKKFKFWIIQLTNYEKELYNFMGVSDYQGLNEKLFGYDTNVFSKIAAVLFGSVLMQKNFLFIIPKQNI